MDDVLKKLFEPDNLKYTVPSLVALCSIMSAFISSITASHIASKTYRLGRDAKIDEVRINRSYKLAEKLAFSIKKLEFMCNTLESLWEENYGHIDSFNAKMNAFHKVPSESIISMIEEYQKERADFLAIIQKAHIYLSEPLLQSAQSYFGCGQFIFSSLGLGMAYDYYDRFFENLLELDAKNKEQSSLFREFFSKFKKNKKRRINYYEKTVMELKKSNFLTR